MGDFMGPFTPSPCTLSKQMFHGGFHVFQGARPPSGPHVIRPLLLLTLLLIINVSRNQREYTSYKITLQEPLSTSQHHSSSVRTWQWRYR